MVLVLLTLIAVSFMILFEILCRILRIITKAILKNSGEPCPFCRNQHSMRTVKTNALHKKACRKCGFSVVIDDTPYIDNSYDLKG